MSTLYIFYLSLYMGRKLPPEGAQNFAPPPAGAGAASFDAARLIPEQSGNKITADDEKKL